MLGIVRDPRESNEAVGRYASDEGMSWRIAFDAGGKAALAFATRGQPETFAISPSGVVVGAKIGPVSRRELEKLLARARVG
jgi:hypothetical protein